jgi:hypothetical protein
MSHRVYWKSCGLENTDSPGLNKNHIRLTRQLQMNTSMKLAIRDGTGEKVEGM